MGYLARVLYYVMNRPWLYAVLVGVSMYVGVSLVFILAGFHPRLP